MYRAQYYDELKALARGVRARFGLKTPRVLRSDLRRIYKAENIRIDLWPYKFRGLRGAYFNDELGATVVLAKGLPEDPMVFTMAHELKHHLADRDLPISYCDASNVSNPIEIGAEIFAAELIYPDNNCADDLVRMGVQPGCCTPEDIVRLKHDTRTTLSYAGIAKRCEFMGFSRPGAFAGVKWKKLEVSLYGLPIYKRVRRQ